MTNQFPGTYPVIADNADATLYGYVFPSPMSPAARVEHGHEQDHWTYATAADGYVSPFRYPTRHGAVLGLLRQCGVTDPDIRTVADLDLIGALHALTGRHTARQVLRHALTYATARAATLRTNTPDPGDLPGRARTGPGPLDRGVLYDVLTGVIGPWTADEVLTMYDKISDHHHTELVERSTNP